MKGKKGLAPKRAQRRPAKRGVPATAPEPMNPDIAALRLTRIEHIVVLMLENRSFDHMLGYLSLEGGRPEVDGLKAEMFNMHGAERFAVRRLMKTAMLKSDDPGHDAMHVAEQLRDGNLGFVSSYAMNPDPRTDLGTVMGYFNAEDLPVYDHIAREFAVCDRWHCSVPGATWPNRLYAVSGNSNGRLDNKKLPLYNQTSFIRLLEETNFTWRWYTHDIGTLRLIDSKYRIGHGNNFWHFDKRSESKEACFFDHAAAGELANVTWIDPNFVDLGGPSSSNDDHPPSDVLNGQDLVLKIYNAILHSPNWPRTLFVIVYDEPGGFYDHVVPGSAKDDRVAFQRYGARVPALVVSPLIDPATVSHTLFDHTSIIKTILARFWQSRPDRPAPMGARVAAANHLGSLLTRATPRPPVPYTEYEHIVDLLASRRGRSFATKMRMQAAGKPAKGEVESEFQEGLVAARKRIRKLGLPVGQP